MDRDTILKQIERYEKLLAAVGDAKVNTQAA